MAVPAPRRPPLRVLTAVPLCDGHDSAITTLNVELARRGVEVIYLGYHQSASAIARAAVQEDVAAIGLSSYNGGHVVFFREVLAQLRARGGADIRVFGGGGGTITAADARALERSGVTRIYPAGTPLDVVIDSLCAAAAQPPARRIALTGDRQLARALSLLDAPRNRMASGATMPTAGSRASRPSGARKPSRPAARAPLVVGVAGPGGVGKSTLIDELVARFLRAEPTRRLAIVANDPSDPGTAGALLGDRVAALYAQDDRVFFRSCATRGHPAGIAASTPGAIALLRDAGEFDFVFIESVGIGQDADPFGVFGRHRSVDLMLLVLSPHYGGPLQLQKIALLSAADLIALNKADDPRVATAESEITAALRRRNASPPVIPTIAAEHEDTGVDALFALLAERAGLEPRGGERACQLQIHD